MISVTSTADSGRGTLRAAIDMANTSTSPVEIDFHMRKGATAITLASGQLELSNTAVPIAIEGPGAGLLAIDGDRAGRVLQIDPNVTASISGLTIRDGHYTGNFFSYSAGGVLNEGTATLADVTLSGNVGGFHRRRPAESRPRRRDAHRLLNHGQSQHTRRRPGELRRQRDTHQLLSHGQ